MGTEAQRAVATAVVIVLAATAFFAIAHPAIRSEDRALRDFSIDYSAARAWRDGGDPFASTSANITRYVAPRALDEPEWHPPLYVVIFIPVSFLSYEAAASFWAILSITAIILAGFVLAQGLGHPGRWGAALGAAALFAPPVVADLGHGQINALLVLLLVIAWRQLRDGGMSGPAALGAAAALKFYPAVIVLALLRRDRRRGIQALLWAVTFTVAAALVTGHISSWIEAASHISGGYTTRPDNFSITSLLARLIDPTPAMIVMGMAAAAFLLWRPRGFWLAVLVALAAWPVVWPHYLVVVVPWMAITIATTTGRVRTMAVAAGCLYAVASLPGPWWAATAGSKPGLWWLAPTATLLAIATSRFDAPIGDIVNAEQIRSVRRRPSRDEDRV